MTQDIVDRLTDRELQSLSNLGNEEERAAAEIASLRAQVAALKADAERWKWWRANTCAHRVGRDGQEFGFPVRDATGTRNLMQGSVAQHLDDEVDAAIRAGGAIMTDKLRDAAQAYKDALARRNLHSATGRDDGYNRLLAEAERSLLSAALAAQPAASGEAPSLKRELQQQCSDWGTYWRAPDAHGVDLTVEQATELLRRALGVEVEIAIPAGIAEAVAAEREGCADEADCWIGFNKSASDACNEIAAAIRARAEGFSSTPAQPTPLGNVFDGLYAHTPVAASGEAPRRGYCLQADECNCGGDTKAVRESCGLWVKPTSVNYERRRSAHPPVAPEPRQLTDEEMADCGLLSEIIPDEPEPVAALTDAKGWLIEHSGKVLDLAQGQVSWLRVQHKFDGYGEREFGYTTDSNKALRFSRKEDAEAVLAMHLGMNAPDWYSAPFSITEHVWVESELRAPQPKEPT
jgi:hypothetical protein